MLTVTLVGRSVARSGFKPQTADALLKYLVANAEALGALLPDKENEVGRIDDFDFLILQACFFSPEFWDVGGPKTRFLPYQLKPAVGGTRANSLRNLLCAEPWEAQAEAINAADICLRWTRGESLRSLEKSFNGLTAGTISELVRNAAWMLSGLRGILEAAAVPNVADGARPRELNIISDAVFTQFRRFVRRVAVLLRSVYVGLPSDALWLLEVSDSNGVILTREEAIKLVSAGIHQPLDIMNNDKDAQRELALSGAKPSPRAKSNRLKLAARSWKSAQRKKIADQHKNWTKECNRSDLVSRMYLAKGDRFEQVVEEALKYLSSTGVPIEIERLDQKPHRGWPDYKLVIGNNAPIVLELKTKASENDLVGLNDAVEVLAASDLCGEHEASCVTLCNPGFDPSVPSAIVRSRRLCVVEAGDFVEALIRLCRKTLTVDQFHLWLSLPGAAERRELPFN